MCVLFSSEPQPIKTFRLSDGSTFDLMKDLLEVRVCLCVVCVLCYACACVFVKAQPINRSSRSVSIFTTITHTCTHFIQDLLSKSNAAQKVESEAAEASHSLSFNHTYTRTCITHTL